MPPNIVAQKLVKPLRRFDPSSDFGLCKRDYVWVIMGDKVIYIFLTFEKAADIHGNNFEVILPCLMETCGYACLTVELGILDLRSCCWAVLVVPCAVFGERSCI